MSAACFGKWPSSILSMTSLLILILWVFFKVRMVPEINQMSVDIY
jgi:hypothetical protein